MTVLMARLRDETQGEHLRLESQLDLMSAALTLDRYRAVMQGFYTYVTPYERRLRSRAPEHLSAMVDRRCRAHLLHQDLLALGLSDRDLDGLTLADDLPLLRSTPGLLGSQYVMEGSTLGGRVIGPHLERQLGLQNGRGYSYFLGHGSETGRLWTEFRHTIDTEVPPNHHDEAIAEARLTFIGLRHWLAGDRTSEVA